MSEISEHDLDEPWDEIWHPTALESSKSVCMPRQFDALRHLAPRTAFTGPGTVTPGHRPPPTAAQARKQLPSPSNPMPHRCSGFGRMKRECSSITEDTPVYRLFHFEWDFLTQDEQTMARSAALPFEEYTI
jgi:hypothetical protein